jgi:anti-sigma B factor antagonist
MSMDTPRTARNAEQAQAPVAFMVIAREIDARTSVITVEGELDLSSAPRLQWMLEDALDAGRGRLLIDLSATSFMDSTGLGVLIGVNRRLAEQRLSIICPPGVVRQVFDFSGTDGAFEIFDTLDAAIAAPGADPPQAASAADS